MLYAYGRKQLQHKSSGKTRKLLTHLILKSQEYSSVEMFLKLISDLSYTDKTKFPNPQLELFINRYRYSSLYVSTKNYFLFRNTLEATEIYKRESVRRDLISRAEELIEEYCRNHGNCWGDKIRTIDDIKIWVTSSTFDENVNTDPLISLLKEAMLASQKRSKILGEFYRSTIEDLKDELTEEYLEKNADDMYFELSAFSKRLYQLCSKIEMAIDSNFGNLKHYGYLTDETWIVTNFFNNQTMSENYDHYFWDELFKTVRRNSFPPLRIPYLSLRKIIL